MTDVTNVTNGQNNSGVKDSSETKHDEFLLHLYDKLWENITNKENRLWTFLSVYAAAIGIVLGTGLGDSQRIVTSFIVLLFTYWAIEIIQDADWWSIRNRLMVSGIERKAGDVTKGVIPPIFQGPKFSTNALYNVCAFVFAVIGSLVFISALSGAAKGLKELLSLEALYALVLYSLLRCVARRIDSVKKYYDRFRELNVEWTTLGLQPCLDDAIEKAENTDRVNESWRVPAFLIYLVVSASVGTAIHRVVPKAVLLFALSQTGVIAMLLLSYRSYVRTPKMYAMSFAKNKLLSGGTLACLLISMFAPVIIGYQQHLPYDPPVSTSSADEELFKDIQEVEKKFQDLQASKNEERAVESAEIRRELDDLGRRIDVHAADEKASRDLLDKVDHQVHVMQAWMRLSARDSVATQ